MKLIRHMLGAYAERLVYNIGYKNHVDAITVMVASACMQGIFVDIH